MKEEILGFLNTLHYKQFTSFFGTKKKNKKYKDYLYSTLLFLKPEENKLTEYLYCLKNNIIEIPKCQKCGNRVSFDTYTTGYRQYCSKTCGSSNIQTVEKRKNTLLNVYGVDNIMKDKRELEKRKKSNLLKYGTEYFITTDEFKIKSKKTMFERYNVTHTSQLKSVQKKKTETNLKKYECEIAVFKQHYIRLLENIKHLVSHNISFKEYLNKKSDGIYSFTCKECNNKFTDYLSYNGLPKCTKCNPYIKSQFEIEIKEYILSLIPNIEIIENTRKVIYNGKFGLELDLYIPEYNLAIEYNGLMRHSFGKSKYRKFNTEHLEDSLKEKHFLKSSLCEEKGIVLLHINEHNWEKEKEEIKNYIKSYLGLLLDYNQEEIKISNNTVLINKLSIFSFHKKNDKIIITSYFGHYNLQSIIKIVCETLFQHTTSLVFTRDYFSIFLFNGKSIELIKSEKKMINSRSFYDSGEIIIKNI